MVGHWTTGLLVSRRSKRFGVADVVPGQVVSTTVLEIDVGNTVGAPFNGYVLRNGSGGVIFVNVNQVLVRLWARRGRKSDRMWSVLNGMGPPASVALCSEACVVRTIGARPGGAEQDDPCTGSFLGSALGVRFRFVFQDD